MNTSPEAVALVAPAKINLSLHVCGKRPDGYHLLDSLVCFAAVGDMLTARRATALHLDVTGPFATGLAAETDNLVLRAAKYLASRHGRPPAAHFTLEKNLPVASGIGGGSSDAATGLLLYNQLWDLPDIDLPMDDITRVLGADVPVCLTRVPMRMAGIGDHLQPPPELPPAWLVLVNPGLPLATKTVFGALNGRHSGPAPALPPHFADVRALADYLAACTNDLMTPAAESLPEIGQILAALSAVDGCLIARLSGSGPTCFGLFASATAADAAANAISVAHGKWWVAPTALLQES
jgi:4-diphosphocytidyl-2-C-methyl-D-erythritol kinase